MVSVVASVASVLALSATGSDVVYATSAKAPTCPQVVLERHAVGQTIRFPRSPTACESTSTGTGIAGVATARGRVLWLYYAGGNLRDWLLFTASTTSRTPKRIRFVERDVSAPAPIVLGRSDETNLPYAVDNVVYDLSPNGSRRYAWTAPGPVAELAAGYDRVAVQLRDGRTYILSKHGTVISQQTLTPGPPIRYAAAGLAIQHGAFVELGAKSFPIGPDAHLVDFIRNTIVYVRGTLIRGIRVSDGKGVLLARGIEASFARGGLAYVAGGIVRWLPWTTVAKRFGN